jgi:phage tail-like protein
MAFTKDKRGAVAGKFALEIDGSEAGWIMSVEGGLATSEVVTEKVGAEALAKKHIGNVKYEDIKVVCGSGMSKVFWEWIESSLNLKYTRKNGSVVACDFNYNEVSRLNFFNALITEIGFPALDAASKDAMKLNLSFGPEYTRNIPKPGGAPKSATKRDQHQWSPANFRVTAEGLNGALSRCSKVEALAIKQKISENPIGELRDYEKEPASMEIPNLVCTVTESHAEEFYQWHEDFVINGNCTEKHEKTFAIQYLDQARKTVLMELELMRCGIFKLTPDKVEAGMEAIRKVKVEMYCEEIRVKANKFWA